MALVAHEATSGVPSAQRRTAARCGDMIAKRIKKTTAADAWATGDKDKAFSEWDFACEAITTGCKKYRDVDGWLTEVRRWPPNLVEAQRAFLERRTPRALAVSSS